MFSPHGFANYMPRKVIKKQQHLRCSRAIHKTTPNRKHQYFVRRMQNSPPKKVFLVIFRWASRPLLEPPWDPPGHPWDLPRALGPPQGPPGDPQGPQNDDRLHVDVAGHQCPRITPPPTSCALEISKRKRKRSAAWRKLLNIYIYIYICIYIYINTFYTYMHVFTYDIHIHS